MTTARDIEEIWFKHRPNQNYLEWTLFLEFARAYFENREIFRPVVVEIGTEGGQQKAQYERFLNAAHIGIDIGDKYSKPDILGNSHAPETLAGLKDMLAGRVINLLFIDAAHTYADAMEDYETYGPLTENLIAFHDIRYCYCPEMGTLWRDIQDRERANPHIAFLAFGAAGSHGRYAGKPGQLGIGVVIKQKNAEYARLGINCIKEWGSVLS